MCDSKFAQAQRAYDNMLPDEDDHFLDTNEGQSWLDDVAEKLIAGDDVKIDRLTSISAYQLSDAVAEAATNKLINHDDDDGMLGQILVAVANYDIATASGCLQKLLGESFVKNLAIEIAAEFADEHVAEMRRRADEDY